MFQRIAVANRGEIAVRIVRTCREMGIRCAVLHTDADKDSLAPSLADDAINLGDVWNYLDPEAVVAAAKQWGADGLHPGYGFLAENAAFARRCAEEGIVFIGPSPEVMEHLGQKDRARASALELGIPCLPGTEDPVADGAEALAAAEAAGWPVLIKAVAGGGGRGMRVARNAEELREQLPRAMSEAEAAFKSGAVYIEKYLTGARHVEVQVMADGYGRVVHLGERDCTVQRRHQKLIEEAPSPGLSDDVREAITADAVRLLRHVGYVNAGTVEFLVDGEGNYYFLEVNTRLQVEHPVTELLFGVDLVEAQIRIAAGEPLPWTQEELNPSGWALECRINAEDPGQNFMPRPGLIDVYFPPGGPGVRVDSAARAGWRIPPFYDSMIAKVIVVAEDRKGAIRRMTRALQEFDVRGVPTTIPFHLAVLHHPDFASGRFDTRFVDEGFAAADFSSPEPSPEAATEPGDGAGSAREDTRSVAAIAAAVAAVVDGPHRIVAVHRQTGGDGPRNMWGAAGRMQLTLRRQEMINPRRNRRT